MSLTEWPRVAWAAFQRDRRIAISYRAGFLLGIVGSVFSIFMVFFMGVAFGDAVEVEQYGTTYFGFALVGIAMAELMGLGLAGIGSRVREGQMTGTLELMVLSPNRLGLLLLSSSLWAHALALGMFVLYLVVAVFLGLQLDRMHVPMALASLALSILSFNALGLLAASFVIVLKQGNPVTWVVGAASMLLAGVYYPTSVLPDWLAAIGILLPLTHALELMRRSMLAGEGLDTLWGPFLALLLLTAILLPAGLCACHLAVRFAQTDGSLSQY
jgi:ABC-2 type transport system permease protein